MEIRAIKTHFDYHAASARYMCMRAEGELSRLTEQQYLDNLHSIGLLWHGPPHPLDRELPSGFFVDELAGGEFRGGHASGWVGDRLSSYQAAVDDCVGADHEWQAAKCDREWSHLRA